MLCPQCGTANPDSNEFCEQCGQALSPTVVADAATHLRSGSVQWGDDPVPDWLLNLQNALPDELRDPELDGIVKARHISAAPGTIDSRAVTDMGESPADQSIPTPIEAESDEWLSSILTSLRPSEETTGSADSVDEQQAWLNSLLASAGREPADAGTAREATPADGIAEFADEEPDWLSDLRSTVADGVPELEQGPANGEREFPAWLQDRLPRPSGEDSGEVPYEDISETQPMPQAEPLKPDAQEPEPPAWLQSIQDTIPTAFSEGVARGLSGLDESQSTREIPEWLQDIDEPYSNLKEAPSTETPVPDWLRAYQEDERPDEPQVSAGDLAVPDWLAEHAIESPTASAVEAKAAEAEETQQFPAFIRPARDEVPPEEEEAADTETAFPPFEQTRGWPDTALLSRVFGDQTVGDERLPAPESAPEPTAMQADSELSAVAADTEGQTLHMEADVRSWLDGNSGEDTSVGESTEEMPATDNEVPDWLREHAAADAAQIANGWPAEMEMPNEFASDATPESPATGDGFDTTDMPDWLASLAQGEDTAEVTGGLSAEGQPPEVLYAQEELPDWLRAAKDVQPAPDEHQETPSAAEAIEDEETLAGMLIEPPENKAVLPHVVTEAESGEEESTPPAPVTTQADTEISEVSAPERYADGSATEPEEWAIDTEGLTYGETPASEPEIRQGLSFAPGGEEETAPAAHITPKATPEDSEALPQWLRDLRKQEKSEELEPPAWLTDNYVPEEGEQTENTYLPAGEDIAGWLAAVTSAEEAIAAEGIPDWLHELDQSEEKLSQGTASPEEGGIPGWLREMGDLESDREIAGIGREESTLPPEKDATTEIPEYSAQQATDTDTPERIDVADRVHGTAEVPAASPESTIPMPAAGTLRPRPVGAREGTVLPALAGTLGIESAVTRLQAGAHDAAQVLPEDTELSEIFQEIVSEPLLPRVSRESRERAHIWQTLGHILIYLLVIAAVVVPLYWQVALGLSYIDEHNIPISAQTQKVYEQINTIPTRELVLLIVDYEPSLAEELNAQARTLLRSLMEREFRILIVSTSLSGSQVIQDIVDELAAQSAGHYQYGRDYLNLGYLPGQETSLALFGRSPLAAVRVDFRNGKELSSYALARSLEVIPTEGFEQIIPLVINLSGNQENLRTWIEQVSAQNTNLNTIAGVSAGLEPYFLPYLKSGQLSGLLSGLVGAAEFEALSEQPARAIRSIDSQLATHLLIVGLILAGNLGYALKRLAKQR